MANPIISRLFVLDGQFNPIGMTEELEVLVAEALNNIQSDIEVIMYRTGRQVTIRRDPVTGQFARRRLE